MTSKHCLKKDIKKILSDAKWLIKSGYSYEFDGEYILTFKKDTVSIMIYYGRYTDPTDVLISIDSENSDRHENGEPYEYSVFEAVTVDPNIGEVKKADGYETAKAGLKLLKNNNLFFDLEYLKSISSEYEEIIYDKLPAELKNLCPPPTRSNDKTPPHKKPK